MNRLLTLLIATPLIVVIAYGATYGIAFTAENMLGSVGRTAAASADESNADDAGSPDGPVYVMKDDLPEAGVRYSESGYDLTPLSAERIEALAAELDHDAYEVLMQCGTERPGSGSLLKNDKPGLYTCTLCGLPLFTSNHKFDSGTGWPSYFKPYDSQHVVGKPDNSHGMQRIETVCGRCDAHLGHVFRDGPRPTRLRFCINSAALTFYEEGEQRPPESRPVETETAYFAGGCFWGIEHYFEKGEGVLDAVSGFMQGEREDPAYRDVVSGKTGHAETVKVVFDPERISYERLLEAFFVMHDPTQRNRQGPDVGPQYRSGIWYANDAQREQAEAYIERLSEQGEYDREIVTEVEAAQTFWPAEAYHQDYIKRTGRACHVENPWK